MLYRSTREIGDGVVEVEVELELKMRGRVTQDGLYLDVNGRSDDE